MAAERPTKADMTPAYERWDKRIQKAIKDNKDWWGKCDDIVKRYMDERSSTNTSKRLNILWSNVETQLPALYANTPKPKASRRFKDKDPLARSVSEVIERATSYSVDEYDFDEMAEAVVLDLLLCGRGVSRVRYKARHGDVIKSENEEGEEVEEKDEDGQVLREVVYEEVCNTYVHYKDFIHSKAKKWQKVSWVAFRERLNQEELESRFGKIGSAVKLDKSEDDESDRMEDRTAVVWEIWHKPSGKVMWWAENSAGQLLDEKDAPQKLKNFFPCPRPLFGTLDNKCLIPKPDYCQYQDQADEIDKLTGRIDLLMDAVKVTGGYDASVPELANMVNSGTMNKLYPVEQWAMLAEKGGIRGCVDVFPIDMIVQTIITLYEARERAKQELFEVSGMSDIIRGASDPNETATAQRIKGQFGSMRLVRKQKLTAKYMRDCIDLQAEIIAEHFSPETIQLMTNQEITPEMVQLMRSDAQRRFRMEIETDSTLEPDEQTEKQARIEFLEMTAGFLERMGPMAMQFPQLGPLIGEMLQFGVRGFRKGRELEESIEETMEQLSQMSQQPPQQDPEKEAKAAQIKQEMEIKGAKAQQDMQSKHQDTQIKVAKGSQEIEQNKTIFELEAAKKMQQIKNMGSE